MKSLFAGYYRPTDEEFDKLWKDCIFVFDASVLLDLYRSTAKTRGVLISILEKIKDRIWLPYQAGWEYQENRLDVIAKERELYVELRETLNGLVKSVHQKMHNHGVESAEKITAELEASIKKIGDIIDQGANEHPNLIAKDHIREKITQLFDGKVGKKLDEKRLASIYQDEGPKRYKQKVPPGYKDSEKGETRQFGDLVVWNEILEQARAVKRPIIFITSEKKEDWWWKQGPETIGPRPELVQEMADFANARFYMYNVERFLDEAQKHFDTKVEATEVKKAAEEFKDIESKREDAILYSTLLDTWKDSGVFKASANEQMQSLQGQGQRSLAYGWLTLLSGVVAADLPVGQWALLLEQLRGKACSTEEINVLQDSFTRELLREIGKRANNGQQVAERLQIYLEAVTGRNKTEGKR